MGITEQLIVTVAVALAAFFFGHAITMDQTNRQCIDATPIVIESTVYVCQKQVIVGESK